MFGHKPEPPVEVNVFNLDAEQGEHWRRIFHELAEIREMQMAISKEVQAALAGITETVSLEQSVVAGLALQATQIDDLKSQVLALTSQVAAGGALSADDMTALGTLTANIATVNTALQTAMPANTAPSAAPADPAAPAADPSKPAPLPGTGAPAATPTT